MIDKIRLNDAQWAQLSRLAGSATLTPNSKLIRMSVRLRSNGLVFSDGKGDFHLTERGAVRLNQGR